MKIYKLLLIVLISSLFSISCDDDLLNTIPEDRISEEIFWQTERDATFAANAIYGMLPTSWDYLMWDGMSDIACVTLDWRSEATIAKNLHDPTDGRIKVDWENLYKGVQASNTFLANIDRIETDNTTLINSLTGEVMVLRSWFYIRLAMLFGDVPLIVESLPLSESYSVSRTPVEQIWDFIELDLTQAANLLPVDQSTSGRITKGAALGLKARAMLYAGRWAKAAEAAKAVMDLGKYSLYPSYENFYTYAAESNSEVIFEQQFERNLGSHRLALNISPNSLRPTANNTVPTHIAVDAFQMTNGKSISDGDSGFDPFNPYENRDPRLRYAIFLPGDMFPDGSILDSYPGSTTGDAVDDNSEAHTRTGFYQRKYFTAEDLQADLATSGINLVHMRYADVLLMYAEAKIEANDIDDSVIEAINQVRARADVNMPAYPLSMRDQNELRDMVRNERLVELCFEGLRYFDIRRWKVSENVIPGKVLGMTYVDENNQLVTVEAGIIKEFNKDRDYLWPLPADELILNENLVQNPNW